ncbi:MAG: membrane integrity-associated transporter subunit PqiC [Deltaproteobacteria bacterium]|nr:membrane integrity-associated transporter subunit PqiC [Deltaproteobacteria bacterium]
MRLNSLGLGLRRALVAATFVLVASSCFGARIEDRSYFVLSGAPIAPMPEVPFAGLVRVQDLDADSAYEKFQIVVRKSPYELRYSDANVWAVKPSQMLSDILAKQLVESRTFTTATRTLGDNRPQYSLGGDLHAIEVYDSNELWYAHLAFSLDMTAFDTGARVFSFRFDERKELPEASFAHAVRALSELLDDAARRAVAELAVIGLSSAHPTNATFAPAPALGGAASDPDAKGVGRVENGDASPGSRSSSGDEDAPANAPFFVPVRPTSP